MLKAIWTWIPVSSGNYKAYNEPFAYKNNKWFFDKSVWQKMFRMMDSCGYNALVMANTHPFPFMVDLSPFNDAKVIDDAVLGDYQNMHHWIFETALDYDIAPYLLFHNIYLPDVMCSKRGIDVEKMSVPSDLSVEYPRHIVRRLLETYPELSGLIADISNTTERCDEFVQSAVVDALDAARPDASLWLRVGENFNGIIENIKRRGSRPISYLAKYTADHLVNSNPDPSFNNCLDTVGAQNVIAEMSFTNFAPFSSFSYETAEEILQNVEDFGCDGFVLHPLAEYEWPRVSDTYFKFQWQRDLVWYHVWCGIGIAQLVRQGQPKWLQRNKKLIEGFQAGSEILELLSLYIAADKHSLWHPLFCCLQKSDSAAPHLLSIDDIAKFSSTWWTEVTGDQVTYISDYLKTGTPEDAYGPDEFIEELSDMASRAVFAGEKGLKNASGEKELPSFSCDVLCLGKLGEFYSERFKAALAHGRSEDSEALEHMTNALEVYREIQTLDSSHREDVRIPSGTGAVSISFGMVVSALEKEYDAAACGVFKSGDNLKL